MRRNAETAFGRIWLCSAAEDDAFGDIEAMTHLLVRRIAEGTARAFGYAPLESVS